MMYPQPVFDEVPLGNLHFDTANPRFPGSLDGSDERAVLRFMLQDAGLLDLMRSIAAQGFFPGEPLLVAPHAAEAGHWDVIEGNRRLAACLLLADPTKAPTSARAVAQVAEQGTAPDALPCLQFGSRPEILIHLGYRHVTGIKEWEPLAKARFLHQRYEELDGPMLERFRELARSIGSRSDYVGRLLTSFTVYQTMATHQFFGIERLSETTIDFSLISSVLAYSNIVDFLGLDSSQDMEAASLDVDHLEELTRWIFERDERRRTRLGESRNIRDLADVVAREDALRAFRSGASLQQAARIAGGASAFRSYLSTARENLELARDQLPDIVVQQADVDAIGEIRTIATQLRNALQERLDEA
jgi:hypothetical protein